MEPPPPSTAAQKDKGKRIQLKKVSKTSPQHLKLQTHSPYVVDKVPTGDSPHVKAEHVQLIDKEPSKTTSLFRSAVNSIKKQQNPPTSHKIQERAKAQEELKQSIMEYKQFLKSCDFINSNSQWRKVQDKLEGDERCSRLEKIDQLEIFQEYIRELEKEEEEHRKIPKEIRRVEHKNRDEFRKLMETHVADGVLTTRMHWRDYCIKVKDLPAYLAVSSNTSGSSPKDLFEDFAEELEKQLINREPCKGNSLFRSAINLILKQEKVGVEIPSIDGALKTQPSSPVKYLRSDIDSFYQQAKQAEEQTDLENAYCLYYSAIEFRDRYDDAVKDLAFLLQRMGQTQTQEAIDLINQHQKHCSEKSQDCLDDILLSLYKGSGRIDEYIEVLQHKLKLVEEGSAFGGRRTKIARSQEMKCHGSIKQDRSRLLGNLAWAYMQQENYHSAKPLYREALFIEPDKNKQCNLAICLMNSGSISEAEYLLQAVTPSSEERKLNASYIKAYDSALKTLSKLENSDSIEEHL